jgi:hypothetical protein
MVLDPAWPRGAAALHLNPLRPVPLPDRDSAQDPEWRPALPQVRLRRDWQRQKPQPQPARQVV